MLSLDDFDEKELLKLPTRLQEKIGQTQEYQLNVNWVDLAKELAEEPSEDPTPAPAKKDKDLPF